MSQRVVIIELNDTNKIFRHIQSNVPDQEEIEQLSQDYEMCGSMEATYEWYEIGEGESDTDTFFTEEELESMSEDLEKNCETKGIYCELIQSGTYAI